MSPASSPAGSGKVGRQYRRLHTGRRPASKNNQHAAHNSEKDATHDPSLVVGIVVAFLRGTILPLAVQQIDIRNHPLLDERAALIVCRGAVRGAGRPLDNNSRRGGRQSADDGGDG
jgi:hypothetical protein